MSPWGPRLNTLGIQVIQMIRGLMFWKIGELDGVMKGSVKERTECRVMLQDNEKSMKEAFQEFYG